METQLRNHAGRRGVLLTRRSTLAAFAAAAGLSALLSMPLPAAPGGVAAGSEAPDFALRTAEGGNLRLSEHRGDVVLLNFWATWCGPCRQEMPRLEEIHARYSAAGLTLLGVNIDEDAQRAESLAKQLGVSFTLLFDDEKAVSRLYDVQAMPMTVMIDKDGLVRSVHHGYRPGVEARYLDEVRALIRED